MREIVFRKYTLLLFSIVVNALGVVLITKAALGTSPISSVPYVFSLISPFSFGGYTFMINMMFVLAEMLLMGKRKVREHRLELVAQVPIVVVFSMSIDVCMWLLADFVPESYVEMLITLVCGCAVLASGIGWAVKADVAMNAGEYLVSVISKRWGKPFGNMKLCFDSSLVATAMLISLLATHTIVGMREGTVLSALLVGPFVRLLSPLWHIFDHFLGQTSTNLR